MPVCKVEQAEFAGSGTDRDINRTISRTEIERRHEEGNQEERWIKLFVFVFYNDTHIHIYTQDNN